MISRRTALLGALATASVAATVARAQTATGPFTLPPLPYAPGDNEPSIDTETMTLHHDKHHAAYVSNLNNALRDHPQVAALGLSGILKTLPDLPETIRTVVRNNAGGHANHSMFWQVMGGKGGAPRGDLAQAFTRDLGPFDEFKTKFNKAGVGVFGSGWVFVTVDAAGKLALATRPNQDTPISDGAHVLFGNDVWEHAYYLKYQNRRADYLAAWWNVLDWSRIAARYDAAKAGTLDI